MIQNLWSRSSIWCIIFEVLTPCWLLQSILNNGWNTLLHQIIYATFAYHGINYSWWSCTAQLSKSFKSVVQVCWTEHSMLHRGHTYPGPWTWDASHMIHNLCSYAKRVLHDIAVEREDGCYHCWHTWSNYVILIQSICMMMSWPYGPYGMGPDPCGAHQWILAIERRTHPRI